MGKRVAIIRVGRISPEIKAECLVAGVQEGTKMMFILTKKPDQDNKLVGLRDRNVYSDFSSGLKINIRNYRTSSWSKAMSGIKRISMLLLSLQEEGIRKKRVPNMSMRIQQRR